MQIYLDCNIIFDDKYTQMTKTAHKLSCIKINTNRKKTSTLIFHLQFYFDSKKRKKKVIGTKTKEIISVYARKYYNYFLSISFSFHLNYFDI